MGQPSPNSTARINEISKQHYENIMLRRIADDQKGFSIIRVKFSNLLSSYYTNNRGAAADILHDFFSTPRGLMGPTSIGHDKLDAVHEMLGLQHGEALLDAKHPVCMEYEPVQGGHTRRVFPPAGNKMAQVFSKQNDPDSHTSKFLDALGEPRISLLSLYCEYLCCLWAGRIENWRLGPGGDDLKAAPYFTKRDDSPKFNRLFAAIYDTFFSKLINMGRLIPSPTRTLKEIFKEKIHGTDKFLISAEIVAFLKWLIYVAAFKDRSTLQHELYYHNELTRFQAGSKQWRGHLYLELEAWYKDFQPSRT
jgi:hypothetical protein